MLLTLTYVSYFEVSVPLVLQILLSNGLHLLLLIAIITNLHPSIYFPIFLYHILSLLEYHKVRYWDLFFSTFTFYLLRLISKLALHIFADYIHFLSILKKESIFLLFPPTNSFNTLSMFSIS